MGSPPHCQWMCLHGHDQCGASEKKTKTPCTHTHAHLSPQHTECERVHPCTTNTPNPPPAQPNETTSARTHAHTHTRTYTHMHTYPAVTLPQWKTSTRRLAWGLSSPSQHLDPHPQPPPRPHPHARTRPSAHQRAQGGEGVAGSTHQSRQPHPPSCLVTPRAARGDARARWGATRQQRTASTPVDPTHALFPDADAAAAAAAAAAVRHPHVGSASVTQTVRVATPCRSAATGVPDEAPVGGQ